MRTMWKLMLLVVAVIVASLGRYYFRLVTVRDPAAVQKKTKRKTSAPTAKRKPKGLGTPTAAPVTKSAEPSKDSIRIKTESPTLASTESTAINSSPSAIESNMTSKLESKDTTSVSKENATVATDDDGKAGKTSVPKNDTAIEDSPKNKTVPELVTKETIPPNKTPSNETVLEPTTTVSKENTTVATNETRGESGQQTEPPATNTDTISTIPTYDPALGSNFTDKWCNLQNTEWFPSGKQQQWQLRAPSVVMIGARDSGTHLVARHLASSSNFVTMESDFFSRSSFKKFLSDNQVLVWPARQRMYARDYKKIKSDTSLQSMTISPNYLFLSPVMPQRVLCVCPWIQLVVVLRDPVDRIYASFQHASQNLGWRGSLQEYVEQDMDAMNTAGLLKENLSKQEEEEAWLQYLLSTRDGPVGRSFYEIQLRQWFRALKEMNREPAEAIHVVRFEEWSTNSAKIQRGLQDFLQIPKNNVATPQVPPPLVENEQDKAMLNQLRKFFRPYNEKLYKLLGDDWKGCWDK